AGDHYYGHQHPPVAVHEQVAALDVSMHDSALVRVGQGARGAPEHVQHRVHGQRTLRLEDGVEGQALDELHHDVQDGAALPHAEHGDDVRGVEPRHHPC